MTTTVQPIRPAAGWSELTLVAWRRSWAFTGLYRRSTRDSMNAARSWTWQWAVVAWQAAATFLPRLIDTAAAAGEIVTSGSASATVHRVDRRRPARLDGLVLAVSAVVVPLAVLVGVEVAVLVTGAGLVPAVAVLLVWLAGAAAVVAGGPRAESPRRLARRARQLTDGPAVVVSSVVAGRQRSGDGTRLMRSLEEQWTRDGIRAAVLYAGSADLVRFYGRVVGGWSLDGASPRRMIWTAGEKR